MPAENVDIVRRAFTAFVENDFEAFFALASEQIESGTGIRVKRRRVGRPRSPSAAG